jgi:fibronectin-binding autotransporter adhesin
VQIGVDLYRSARDHLGLYGARGRMDADVQHFDATFAGQNRVKSWTLGGYWTHFADSGWYTDLVAQYSWNRLKTHTIGLTTSSGGSNPSDMNANGDIFTKGHGVAVSFETGKAFALGNRTILEPQGQLIWQQGRINSFTDPYDTISFGKVETLEGRLGARLAKNWSLTANAPDRLTTLWIRPSIRYTFTGTPRSVFTDQGGSIAFASNLKGAAFDLTGGVDGQITRNLTAYVSGVWLRRFDSLGDSYGVKGGLRMAW